MTRKKAGAARRLDPSSVLVAFVQAQNDCEQSRFDDEALVTIVAAVDAADSAAAQQPQPQPQAVGGVQQAMSCSTDGFVVDVSSIVDWRGRQEWPPVPQQDAVPAATQPQPQPQPLESSGEAAAEGASGDGSDGEKPLAQLCTELVTARAERVRGEPVGDKPREMYKVGLPPVFWLALDAKMRHWAKRRMGKYNPTKIMFKVIGFVLWNLRGDLARLGFEPDWETLKDAVLESGLLGIPEYFLEHLKERWDLLV